MRLFLSVLVGLFALSAQAGGIGFKKEYVGTHPLSGRALRLEFRDDGIRLSAEHTIGRGRELVQRIVSRNNFETIFALHEKGETEEKPGAQIARIVTTGDCQIVERLAVVYPSGLQAVLVAVPEKED